MYLKQGYGDLTDLYPFKHLGEGAQVFDPEKSIFLKPEVVEIGDHSRIDGLVKLEGGQGITIGKHVHISSFVHVIGGGELIVEDGAALTSGVKVVTGSNTQAGYYMSSAARPEHQHVKRLTTIVREGAFVGANAVLLPGVWIGRFAIVGAGAVVTKNVPDFAVVMGIPAKIVGYRTDHPAYAPTKE